jgi:hypothetical protein
LEQNFADFATLSPQSENKSENIELMLLTGAKVVCWFVGIRCSFGFLWFDSLWYSTFGSEAFVGCGSGDLIGTGAGCLGSSTFVGSFFTSTLTSLVGSTFGGSTFVSFFTSSFTGSFVGATVGVLVTTGETIGSGAFIVCFGGSVISIFLGVLSFVG